MYWPGDKPCCAVARSEVTADLPADMIEALGEPCLVSSETDVWDALRADVAGFEAFRAKVVDDGCAAVLRSGGAREGDAQAKQLDRDE
jgi:hypothetical protein